MSEKRIETGHHVMSNVRLEKVSYKNIDAILERTGCDQIHVARFRQYTDPSTANNRDIFYGGALYPPEDRYDVIDGDYIGQIRSHL